jgi:hypothetical protein
MKTKTILIVLAVLCGVSVLVTNAYLRGRWQERVDDLQDQVDSTDNFWSAKYAVDSTAWVVQQDSLQRRDSILTLDAMHLALREDSLKALKVVVLGAIEAAEAKEDTLTLLTRIKQALTLSDGLLRVCQAQRGVAEDRRGVCMARLARQTARIASLEKLRARLQAERDSAMALLKPPPLFSLDFEIGVGVGCAGGLGGNVACGPAVQFTILRLRLPFINTPR